VNQPLSFAGSLRREWAAAGNEIILTHFMRFLNNLLAKQAIKAVLPVSIKQKTASSMESH